MRVRLKDMFAVAVVGLWFLPSGAHGASVSFSQIDWLDGAGGYTSYESDWGGVQVTLDVVDAAYFAPVSSGYVTYVNVTTTVAGGAGGNWGVQNLAVVLDDLSADTFVGRLGESVFFDLGIAPGSQRVSDIEYILSLGAAPLASAPSGAMAVSGVDVEEVLFGGLIGTVDGETFEGGTSQAAPPAALNFVGVGPGEQVGGKGAIKGKEKDVPKVAEDKNHCAPGSAARSLKYLAAHNPNVNVPDDPTQLHKDLAKEMKTTLKSGTWVDRFKSGKDEYVEKKKLPIRTKQTKNVEDVIDALKKGADVELMVYWGKNSSGKSMGGHAAFVTEITEIKNAAGETTGYQVKTIDDAKQGDGKAANDPHTYRFDKDGKLRGFGTGAGLIGYQIETVRRARAWNWLKQLLTQLQVQPGWWSPTPQSFSDIWIFPDVAIDPSYTPCTLVSGWTHEFTNVAPDGTTYATAGLHWYGPELGAGSLSDFWFQTLLDPAMAYDFYAYDPSYDEVWLEQVDCEPIPEPVTALGILLGVGCLGRYAARRSSRCRPRPAAA